MFTPKYTITNTLLANIKHIYSLVHELNNRHFSKVVLFEMERSAREISAYSSTSIEGNPLPLTEVKKILKSKPENTRDSELEVINYNQALVSLNNELKNKQFKLSQTTILTIHSQVVKGLLPKHDTGKIRKVPVIVNDPKTGKVAYLPPANEIVEELMKDLINFTNQNKKIIDPLIIAGIFHKQMVVIHPFIDGNGRTTRLVTKALLTDMGLDTFNLFSFENYYNQNVTKYFQTVGEFGDYNELLKNIDFTVWLEYFTAGIIDELMRVKKVIFSKNTTPENKVELHHKKILEFIEENGFIADRDYAKLTNRAKATRALDFLKLVKLKMIKRNGKGRSTYYTISSPNLT